MPVIDPLELRRALGSFMTGVTVVTTVDQQSTPLGFTANSFTSVSLNEPLVLFCLSKQSHNLDAYTNTESFAINVLAENQRGISTTFAAPNIHNRFATVQWYTASTGCPILSHCAAWFDCTMHQTVEAGDHVVVIGRVVAFDYIAANPLGYWKGNYVSALLEHKATEASQHTSSVGAILERDNHILMVEQANGLHLPYGSHIGSPDEPQSLLGVLNSYGVEAEIGFVFSVFEGNPSAGGVAFKVYYRGTTDCACIDSRQARWYPIDNIPWERVPNKETRTMLNRYINESLGGRYSIYVGDIHSGKVHTIK